MHILLFGIAKEIVGQHAIDIANDVKITSVADVKKWLNDTYPAFQQLSSFAVAVNREYTKDEQALNGSEEIAILPPISGG